MKTKLTLNFVIVLAVYFSNCKVQQKSIVPPGFEEIGIQFYADPKALNFTRIAKNTFIHFGREIDDSIVVFYNNKQLTSFTLSRATERDKEYSYPAHSLAVDPIRKSNSVDILLVNSKKYFSFTIDRKFPLYTIDKIDTKWIVNARLGLTIK